MRATIMLDKSILVPMAAQNGASVYDMVTEGWSRKVFDRNNQGNLGVGVPAEFADEHNIELGDKVAIIESDTKDGVLEIHFK